MSHATESNWVRIYFHWLLFGLALYSLIGVAFNYPLIAPSAGIPANGTIWLDHYLLFTVAGVFLVTFWLSLKYPPPSSPSSDLPDSLLWTGSSLIFILVLQRALQWDVVSPFHDELTQFFTAQNTWPAITAKVTNNSPLQLAQNYLSLYLWKGDLRLRFNPLLFSTLASTSFFVLAYHWLRKPLLAFVLALFFNFAPFVLKYSYEGHWLAFAFLTFTIALFFFTETLANPSSRQCHLQLVCALILFGLALPTRTALIYLMIGALLSIMAVVNLPRAQSLRLVAYVLVAFAATAPFHTFFLTRNSLFDVSLLRQYWPGKANLTILALASGCFALGSFIWRKWRHQPPTLDPAKWSLVFFLWLIFFFPAPTASPNRFILGLVPVLLLVGLVTSHILQSLCHFPQVIRTITSTSLILIGIFVFSPQFTVTPGYRDRGLTDARSVIKYLKINLEADEGVFPVALSSYPWNEELDLSRIFYGFRPEEFEPSLVEVLTKGKVPYRIMVVLGGFFPDNPISSDLWRDLTIEATTTFPGRKILILSNRHGTLISDLGIFISRLEIFYGLGFPKLKSALAQYSKSR